MAFSLREGVYIVRGAARAALYDTNTGKVYSINEQALQVLEGRVSDDDFWAQLVRIGIAERGVSRSLAYLPQALNVSSHVQQQTLGFVWFEVVSSDCNERCRHCYVDSMPPSFRRAMEQKLGLTFQKGIREEGWQKENSKKLSFQSWVAVMEESYSLGARSCQFIGGEPFLYRDSEGHDLLSLIRAARQIGFEEIEVFTNGTLLTEARVRVLKEIGVKAAISLYSSDPKVHDFITRTPGSWKKTVQGLKYLQTYKVPARVEIIIMRWNERDIEQTVKWLRKEGFKVGTDVVRPTGRGGEGVILPSPEGFKKYGLIQEANFHAQLDFIKRSIIGNNCLAGKVTITEMGDVLPCIFSRDLILGNVQQKSLTDIISNPLTQSVWSHSKDKVKVCQDCEYRYVCSDCRALSFSLVPPALRENKEKWRVYLNSPYPRCTYNPYTGSWGSGVWKLDEQGKARYVNLSEIEEVEK